MNKKLAMAIARAPQKKHYPIIALAVVAIVIIALAVVAIVIIASWEPYQPENPVYQSYLKLVTVSDDSPHLNWTNLHDRDDTTEIWAPLVQLQDPSTGEFHSWGNNFENYRIEEVTYPDSETIRIYGDEVELVLKPLQGYRRITLSANWDKKNASFLAWGVAEAGDVMELTMPNLGVVFWGNRGDYMTVEGFVNGVVHYQAFGLAKLTRGGETYHGVSNFQRIWLLNDRLYDRHGEVFYQDAFHIFTEEFSAYIQTFKVELSNGRVVEVNDGMLYFAEDKEYVVLGDLTKGYRYSVTELNNRETVKIEINSHKGLVELLLNNPTNIPRFPGLSQDIWGSISAVLKGKEVEAVTVSSEIIREKWKE